MTIDGLANECALQVWQGSPRCPYADDADHLRTKLSSGIWPANPGEMAVAPCARPLLETNRATGPWPAPDLAACTAQPIVNTDRPMWTDSRPNRQISVQIDLTGKFPYSGIRR